MPALHHIGGELARQGLARPQRVTGGDLVGATKPRSSRFFCIASAQRW